MDDDNYIAIKREFAIPSEEQSKDLQYRQGWVFEYAQTGIQWSDLLAKKRLVILGEAKCGKTTEFRQQAKSLQNDGKFAFFLPLAELYKHSLDLVMDDPDKFNDWIERSGDEAWFFLDSVDELKLQEFCFKIALRKLRKEISGKEQLVHIFVSCRPSDWNKHFDLKDFQDVFPIPAQRTQVESSESPVANLMSDFEKPDHDEIGSSPQGEEAEDQVTQLLPLDRNQAIEFANQYDQNRAGQFADYVDKPETWHLYQTPADIIDGIALIDEQGALETPERQMIAGIRRKIKERGERSRKREIEEDEAQLGAERIALAMTLCQKFSLCINKSDSNNHGLDAANILTNWKQEERNELLSSGLFDFSGINSVRFHHRSTREFLAARRIRDLLSKGLPIRELLPLLFFEIYGEKGLVTQMEPVTAWVALWNEPILHEVIKRKPELLFRYGLPLSLSIEERKKILRGYVELYSKDDFRGVAPSANDVKKFADKDLSPLIEELWCKADSGCDTRDLLLELISCAPTPNCISLALPVALCTQMNVSHRVTAAITVLREGTDEQKQKVGQSITKGNWPSQAVCGVLPELYPSVLPVEEFINLARSVSKNISLGPGPGWAMHELMKRDSLKTCDIRILRNELTKLVWESRSQHCHSYNHSSEFGYFADAIVAGCSLDSHNETEDEIREWGWSFVIGIMFSSSSRFGRAYEDRENLQNKLQDNQELRKSCFWSFLELEKKLAPNESTDLQSQVVRRNCVICNIGEGDISWLLDALGNKSMPERRGIAFYALMNIWKSNTENQTILDEVENLISDLPELGVKFKKFICLRPPYEPTEYERLDEEDKKRQKEINRWKAYAVDNPELVLSGCSKEDTIRRVVNCLNKKSNQQCQLCVWDANSVRNKFSAEFLEHLRPVFSEFWRRSNPQSWSELPLDQKYSVMPDSGLLLTAVACEAEDSNWAKRLNDQDVRLATRISMLEIRGFAAYLPSLEKAHPERVVDSISKELSAQLAGLKKNDEMPLLLAISDYRTGEIKKTSAAIVGKSLDAWPDTLTNSTRRLLEYAAVLIRDSGSNETIRTAEAQVMDRLNQTSLVVEDRISWLKTLMAFNTAEACHQILKETIDLSTEDKRSNAVKLFGQIFSDPDFASVPESKLPNLLQRLVQRIYRVAPPAKDNNHKGAFRPNLRDHAEHARDRLFEYLIKLSGKRTYDAIIELSSDDDFPYPKSRLRQLALEVAARSVEKVPMSIEDFNSFDQKTVLIPNDTRKMHEVMLSRLDDYIHYLDHSEYANKSLIQRVEKEVEVRRIVAERFNEYSREAFTVSQESVKAGENRTDITLKSSSGVQSVIEIKLVNKHGLSATKLEDALRNQLVGKYMREDNCFSGCLLIFMREERQWRNPTTNNNMDLNGTVGWLKGVADQIMHEKPERFIAVRGISLVSSTN